MVDISSKHPGGRGLIDAIENARPASSPKDSGEQSPAEQAVRPKSKRRAVTTTFIIMGWGDRGPLIHESSGFPELDAAIGGGPVYGTRLFILGPPDACKTLLLICILHWYAEQGLRVGIYAADEEADDICIRLLQRKGFTREECEARGPSRLQAMVAALSSLDIRFYDASWTIEEAAADLADGGVQGILGIDSIQTAVCDFEKSNPGASMQQAVDARLDAVRDVASRYRHILLGTSEMGRTSYSSAGNGENRTDLAGAKWSGKFEYSARVLISLRRVKDHPTMVSVELPKNKHGHQRMLSQGDALYMTFDRDRQSMAEAAPPKRPTAGERAAAKQAERTAKIAKLANEMLWALAAVCKEGGIITTQEHLRGLVRGDNALKTAAVAQLVQAGRLQGGHGQAYVPVLTDEDEPV